MPTYTVQFNTDTETASRNIEALTPEQALTVAHAIVVAGDHENLIFKRSCDDHPVDQIVVNDEMGSELCKWRDDDLCLRLAAPQLLKAARTVISSWECGDLGDVHETITCLAQAIARAEALSCVQGTDDRLLTAAERAVF